MLVRYEQVEKGKIKPGKQARAIEVDDNLRRLADSLAEEGQLQPIGLLLEDYTPIWGLRRIAAAMLSENVTHLWAALFCEAITEAEFLRMRAVENFQRLDLTPYQKFLTIDELRLHHPDWTTKELAAFLHLDPSQVSRILSLSKCVEPVIAAGAAGKLQIADWSILSKASPEEQLKMLRAKLSGSITSRDDLERVRQRGNGSVDDKPKVSLIKIVLDGVSVCIRGAAVSLDKAIKVLPDALKELERAKKGGHDAKTFAALMKKREKGSADDSE